MHPNRRGIDKRNRSFPRTRGDAPPRFSWAGSSSSLPPHTRGCTASTGNPPVETRASPAHAGMHRRARRNMLHRKGFPRTRGDAPSCAGRAERTRLLPPHTRGCTQHGGRAELVVNASPAHAGMHRPAPTACRARGSFPRTCGDAPREKKTRFRAILLPPHTRGCTQAEHSRRYKRGASPAHAGMHPGSRRAMRSCASFPRTRGDAPRRRCPAPSRSTLPPHTRGCTPFALPVGYPERASPAHAGMHPRMARHLRGRRRFPRTRGDAPASTPARNKPAWLPPHTRGCTRTREGAPRRRRASPAHAGMHPSGTPTRVSRTRFPRTRGDAPASDRGRGGGARLPPHTRGCTWPRCKSSLYRRASPHTRGCTAPAEGDALFPDASPAHAVSVRLWGYWVFTVGVLCFQFHGMSSWIRFVL